MKRLFALPIILALTSGTAPAAQNGSVTGKVVVADDHGKQLKLPDNVWVYLEPIHAPSQPGKGKHAEIQQADRKFVPDTIVVPTGTEVDFPNKDREKHNVFSPNAVDLEFDLGVQTPSHSASRKFEEKGDFDIYCDRHKTMAAKVKVVDTTRIVHVTDGTFRFDDVPPGVYKATAWMPFSKDVIARVTVEQGTIDAGELHLHPGIAPKTHLNKTRQPYGVYDDP